MRLTIEDYRTRNNLSVEEVCKMIDVPCESYNKIKDSDVSFYVLCDEIREFLRKENVVINSLAEELGKLFTKYGTELCEKKERIIMNTVRCSNEKAISLLLYCSKKSVSY